VTLLAIQPDFSPIVHNWLEQHIEIQQQLSTYPLNKVFTLAYRHVLVDALRFYPLKTSINRK